MQLQIHGSLHEFFKVPFSGTILANTNLATVVLGVLVDKFVLCCVDTPCSDIQWNPRIMEKLGTSDLSIVQTFSLLQR